MLVQVKNCALTAANVLPGRGMVIDGRISLHRLTAFRTNGTAFLFSNVHTGNRTPENRAFQEKSLPIFVYTEKRIE